MRNFTKPVLLFKGVGSSAFLHRITDILRDEFPHSKLVILPGGHAPHLASMKEFLETLSDFIKP